LINNFAKKAHHAATEGSFDGLAARKEIGCMFFGKRFTNSGVFYRQSTTSYETVILRKAPVQNRYLLEMTN
jgi:hypothetical protein